MCVCVCVCRGGGGGGGCLLLSKLLFLILRSPGISLGFTIFCQIFAYVTVF